MVEREEIAGVGEPFSVWGIGEESVRGLRKGFGFEGGTGKGDAVCYFGTLSILFCSVEDFFVDVRGEELVGSLEGFLLGVLEEAFSEVLVIGFEVLESEASFCSGSEVFCEHRCFDKKGS